MDKKYINNFEQHVETSLDKDNICYCNEKKPITRFNRFKACLMNKRGKCKNKSNPNKKLC